MSELLSKKFDEPDEVVSVPGVLGQVVVVGDTHVGRYTHEPGWCWSKNIKPRVGTQLCQFHHQGIMLSGRMQITMANGAQRVIGPGEAFNIPPGHDGFVIGDEPCVTIEFRGVRDWAKPANSSERILTTMLFTDIVGSTAMATKIGDAAWKNLLAKHTDRIGLLLDKYRGYQLETTGDGFLFLFDGAARAIQCAAEICDKSREDGIEVRTGIHTGEINIQTDGVQGLAVHIAARIMSLAGPGDVMVSASTVTLLEGSGLSFTDAGEHELKGVDGKRRVYRLVID